MIMANIDNENGHDDGDANNSDGQEMMAGVNNRDGNDNCQHQKQRRPRQWPTWTTDRPQ